MIESTALAGPYDGDALEPTMRYARTSDGVSIAYFEIGDGPPLLWLPPVPFSNVLGQWRIPTIRRAYERLGAHVRLIMYDGRGTGRSQRDVDDLGLDAMLRDLEAVVGHAGTQQFALLGYYHAALSVIAYAAGHPGRVTRLVLFGASMRAMDSMSAPETQALLTLIERDWDLFVDTAARAWMGWSAADDSRLVADAFRDATTPAIARATLDAAREIDVSAEVGSVTAPALVLHRQGERQMPLEVSRALADALPNGRLLQLSGESAGLFFEDPDADVDVLLDFLTGTTADGARVPSTADNRAISQTDGLTSREVEVLRLIAQGDSNAEIAHRLGLSVHTVERHAANLYRKIGARGRADATAYAVRRGLA